jgi:hypothetical protein
MPDVRDNTADAGSLPQTFSAEWGDKTWKEMEQVM